MYILTQTNSLANHFLSELRDRDIQRDSMRFRKNLERVGELIAYELSKSMEYQEKTVETVLGSARVNHLKRQPVIVTILRAGIPFYQGFINYFDQAESGFIGAYCTPHTGKDDFDIMMEYVAVNKLDGKELVLVDPMLATGRSIVTSLNSLLAYGTPAKIHIAAAVAAPEGIAHLKEHIKGPYALWVGAVDHGLNDKAYIVPGLGDAGDLSFGSKL